MIQTFFEIDEDGYIVNKYKIDKHREEVPEYLVERWEGVISKPRYIREIGKWIEMAKDYEVLGFSSIDEAKREKDKELRLECNQRIIEGFSIDGEHYSYNQEKQINFQDTYQLFLNNMITEIAWNAYVDGKKTRVLLDKDKFQRAYLAGVKHKQDCIIHLNDILIPLVESSADIEALRAISWGEQKSSFKVSNEKNIAKKIENLSEDSVAQKSINEQVESIVLEIADIAISGF